MPVLKLFEKYIPFALPFLLFFFRGLADLTVVVLSAIFLYKSFKESKWSWAKDLWFKYSVIFVLYLVTINAYISIDPSDTLFYALTFIRWPIFAAALYFWIFNYKVAIKSFLISLGLLLAFIIVDVWIQYLIGNDIFGYPSLGLRLTGPLRDNPVIGIFITKFIFISLTSLLVFKKINQNNNRYLFLFLLMIIGFLSVFITGERMSLLLFFSAIPLVLIGFSKDFTRVVINIALLFTILAFLALLIGEFFPQTYERAINSTIYKLSNFKESDYGLVYQSTYQAWLQNIWVGGGLHQLKDLYSLYDINLWVDNNGAQIKIFHAHNHPLSLLAETGLVGLFLYFLIIIQIIRKIFKESYQQDNWLKFTLLITLIYICFWPLMSHFSFQHNWMNAINWLIVGLVLALSKKMENE
tara:strand:- start:272 stop:1504 length:1233 start_codon:yes stop_codon:yes gene_type:complete